MNDTDDNDTGSELNDLKHQTNPCASDHQQFKKHTHMNKEKSLYRILHQIIRLLVGSYIYQPHLVRLSVGIKYPPKFYSRVE